MHRNDIALVVFLGLMLTSICALAVISQLDLSANMHALSSIADVDSAEFRRESTEATIRVYQAQAHWAAVSAAISAAGAIVTAAGLLFVAAQLKVSQAQLNKDRAYIHFDGMKWLSFVDQSGTTVESWGIFPRWINTGVTPAINVSIRYQAGWLPSVDLPDFGKRLTGGHLTTIRPSGQIEMAPVLLPPADIIRSGHNGEAFCIWGAAIYNDVLQKSKTRETRFCVKILGHGGDPTKEWDEVKNPVVIHFANVGENWAT